MGVAPSGTTRLTTDVDGVQVDSNAQIRCYDAAGRTRRVVDVALSSTGCPDPIAGGKKIDYVYGGDGIVGRSSESTTGTARRLFFYFGTSQARAEETAPDGTTKIRYLVAPGTGVLAQQKPEAARSWIWLLRDASQNVATHVATDGTVTAQKAYDPYGGKEEGGTKTSAEDPGANTEAQGSHADRETNNLFLGPRIYDPTTDRFTTPDFFVASGPDLALGTDPLTGNRYLFAAANPVAFFENGYEPCPKDSERGCDYYYSGSNQQQRERQKRDTAETSSFIERYTFSGSNDTPRLVTVPLLGTVNIYGSIATFTPTHSCCLGRSDMLEGNHWDIEFYMSISRHAWEAHHEVRSDTRLVVKAVGSKDDQFLIAQPTKTPVISQYYEDRVLVRYAGHASETFGRPLGVHVEMLGTLRRGGGKGPAPTSLFSREYYLPVDHQW